MIMTAIGAAVATCALAGAPAPGHGIYSDITSAVPLTNQQLLVAKPYPDNRTSTTTYTNSGRLWTPYTAQDKILSSLYPGGGPATIGAPMPGTPGSVALAGTSLGAGDVIIFVRPESEPWPDVAISPYQNINRDTLDEIFRRHPWLQRSPERSERLVNELRYAQRRYLRQQGYVAGVRTHVNPMTLQNAGETADAGKVEPSATIRLTPRVKPQEELRTSLPEDFTTVRVSLPGQSTPEPRITVVRQETTSETGAGEHG